MRSLAVMPASHLSGEAAGRLPEQIEEEALEYAALHGPEAVLLPLASHMERSRIDGWVVERIRSLLMPGPWEVPPEVSPSSSPPPGPSSLAPGAPRR